MIKNISIVFIVFSLTACAQFDGNFLNSSDPVVEQSNDDISNEVTQEDIFNQINDCLLYTSPSPRDRQKSRMPSSA